MIGSYHLLLPGYLPVKSNVNIAVQLRIASLYGWLTTFGHVLCGFCGYPLILHYLADGYAPSGPLSNVKNDIMQGKANSTVMIQYS